MNTISPNTLLDRLEWRYATKKFDPARKIPADQWRSLEQALVLSPSSFGLQPWKFIVVENPAVRERLVDVSWGQRQVADASHLVVFAAKTSLSERDVDHYIARMAQVRGIAPVELAGFRSMVLESLRRRQSERDPQGWHARQVYIALGNFMTSAAMLGIDTCPLEGIEPERYDEILGLPEKGLSALCAIAAGYRASDDKYATTPKVRFPAEEVIVRN